tara:strand:+ start:488 stop:652 length:165 start_codon:yes stop_codon:yes gene_type:complete
MDFIIALFIVCTSALVGILAAVSAAAGVSGMTIVIVGCIACFIGGNVIIAKELS